jgi:hypothetical protein
MKVFLVAAMALLSTSAFASGGFTCESLDGQVQVNGGYSSAGTWVQSVVIGGESLVKGDDFTADQLYNNGPVFNFKIMDGEYNRILLVVETVAKNDLTAGLVTVNPYSDAEEVKVITCEFSY